MYVSNKFEEDETVKSSLKSLWRPGKILDFRMLKQWTKI